MEKAGSANKANKDMGGWPEAQENLCLHMDAGVQLSMTPQHDPKKACRCEGWPDTARDKAVIHIVPDQTPRNQTNSCAVADDTSRQPPPGWNRIRRTMLGAFDEMVSDLDCCHALTWGVAEG